jgi:hypothetical protein
MNTARCIDWRLQAASDYLTTSSKIALQTKPMLKVPVNQ